jgi:hypothetical protein
MLLLQSQTRSATSRGRGGSSRTSAFSNLLPLLLLGGYGLGSGAGSSGLGGYGGGFGGLGLGFGGAGGCSYGSSFCGYGGRGSYSSLGGYSAYGPYGGYGAYGGYLGSYFGQQADSAAVQRLAALGSIGYGGSTSPSLILGTLGVSETDGVEAHMILRNCHAVALLQLHAHAAAAQRCCSTAVVLWQLYWTLNAYSCSCNDRVT